MSARIYSAAVLAEAIYVSDEKHFAILKYFLNLSMML